MLGVPRFAAPAAVRRAYVAQLKGHHGGASPLSDERLRRLGVAYWELRHPDRRAAYDATLRERERRRTAAGRPVTKRAAPRVRLPPPRSRPGTRWVFAASLALLAGGIAWALERRPAPVVASAGRDAQAPTLAMIDEALLDYRAIMAAGGPGQVERQVRQCFADMRASAPAAAFDYCVALDGLAAAELGSRAGGFFGDDARRSRLAAVAFESRDAAADRWAAVNRLVATR